MNREALCQAFCADVAVREVPVGYAIKTPFTRPDGDFVSFYARRLKESGELRLEDDGGTIAFLEANGVDLETESRRELFAALLEEYRAVYDEGEYLIHSANLREDQVPGMALRFSALMLRVYDLLWSSQRRVAKTFKEDLAQLVEATFTGPNVVEVDAYINEDMRDYLADFIVRSPTGGTLAIFAASTETKALEALLFWREARERALTNVRSMLVLERPKPQAIKDRTLSRAFNSGLSVAVFEHERSALAGKMRDTLEGRLH